MHTEGAVAVSGEAQQQASEGATSSPPRFRIFERAASQKTETFRRGNFGAPDLKGGLGQGFDEGLGHRNLGFRVQGRGSGQGLENKEGREATK